MLNTAPQAWTYHTGRTNTLEVATGIDEKTSNCSGLRERERVSPSQVYTYICELFWGWDSGLNTKLMFNLFLKHITWR